MLLVQKVQQVPTKQFGIDAPHANPGRSFGTKIFFLLRTALKDRPKGPSAANYQPPPIATNRQPPLTTNRQLPPTASGDQPPTANHC